jgi:hypothetical protein
VADLLPFGAALLLGYLGGRLRPLWRARAATRWKIYGWRRNHWLYNLHMLLLVPDHFWHMWRRDRRG